MTNEQAKQKAIQDAYGEHWGIVKDYVSDDGWCGYYPGGGDNPLPLSCKIDITEIEREEYYRPTSLRGIDDNNGWTRIEREDDLPKDAGEYEFIAKKYREKHRLYYYPNSNISSTSIQLYSHWRKIEEVPPPIY